MKLSTKGRQIIGWVLIGYMVLHIVLNLGEKPEVFFLFAYIKMPVAFLVIAAAAMGAGAMLAFRFMKAKKDEEKKET